jgi:hypothetical protein
VDRKYPTCPKFWNYKKDNIHYYATLYWSLTKILEDSSQELIIWETNLFFRTTKASNPNTAWKPLDAIDHLLFRRSVFALQACFGNRWIAKTEFEKTTCSFDGTFQRLLQPFP